MDFEQLKPFEEVLDQVGCNYRKFKPNEKGVMVITTCRVLWKPIDSTQFPVQILRSFKAKNGPLEHIKVACRFNQAKTAKESSYYAMKLVEPAIDGEEQKDYFFRFVDEKRMLEDSSRVQKLLKV